MLGILPQIITTVATVGPTVYGLVDAYQQRQRENAKLLAQAAAEHGAPVVPVGPQRAEWVVPVVSAVVVSAGASYALYWWWTKHGKGKKGKRASDDE